MQVQSCWHPVGSVGAGSVALVSGGSVGSVSGGCVSIGLVSIGAGSVSTSSVTACVGAGRVSGGTVSWGRVSTDVPFSAGSVSFGTNAVVASGSETVACVASVVGPTVISVGLTVMVSTASRVWHPIREKSTRRMLSNVCFIAAFSFPQTSAKTPVSSKPRKQSAFRAESK